MRNRRDLKLWVGWPGKVTFAKSTCEYRLKKVRVLVASVSVAGVGVGKSLEGRGNSDCKNLEKEACLVGSRDRRS